ncbi:threonine synthase [Longilinea arvoryzae]|uniref:Threonine synthase n=1 Tax=Longilinea arvoryzae TaxID=360412 RepID=A0A0S7BAZ7_9CHLR|nr:pyridoxal-phosphate dependent enzyme [Longilinea arvoryzae]GAP14911.1 threonine synthase [Longilinea arvoryzae]
MSTQIIAECQDCGFQAPYSLLSPVCPNCGSEWREAHYDYAALGQRLPGLLSGRPFNLWRYHELLPIQSPSPEISLGEGGTPLFRATNLGLMLGNSNIYIKDERQGPTHSFKDRQAAVTIAALKEAGVNEMVLASTGNVAIAYSAFAARAGIRLWVFLTSLVPAVKMRETALYGTQVVKVTGSYDQAKQTAALFAKRRGLFLDTGARSIPCIESMKTIAFETSEQLTGMLGAPSQSSALSGPVWQAPDWYIQSISGGMGPLGVLKGYDELMKMGLIDHFPKFGLVQVEGCAPMVHAWKQGKDVAQPVAAPRTLIHTLATGDPGRTYTMLRKKILEKSDGFLEMVSDEEAYRAMHFLAKMEGLSVEPAAAVAFAGVIKMVRAGIIKPNESVVINCTGHTMPVERNILGEGWSKDLTSLGGDEMEESKEEGLLAALSKVGIDRFPRIAIVDDNPQVRQLIRRILQSQGNYTLFEATNGLEAIDLAKKEHPNLIILDLMMPEMDGFAVMDALQADSETADIPIIVVTAKELTPAEKERLRGHIQTLMQKGDFLSDDLLDEVRALLR